MVRRVNSPNLNRVHRNSMQKHTFLILLLCCGYLRAQVTISDKLKWKEQSEEPYVASFQGSRMGYSYNTPALARYCHQVAGGSFRVKYRPEIISLQTEPVRKAAELKALRKAEVPTELNVEVTGSGKNKQPFMGICFLPYLKSPGGYQRVTGFQIELRPKAGRAAQFRAKSSASVQNSKLNSEGWHKISVSSTDIYKITPEYLTDNNITSEEVPINNIRIVGNNLGMLPESNSVPRPQQLREVPMHRVDQNQDGQFNGDDYVLFYAKSPHVWNYDSASGRYSHRLNVYREQNYLFLTVQNGSGQTPSAQASAGTATTTVTAFDDYDYVEDEQVNFVGTGRQWFGDKFDFDLSYNYGFNFPDIITSEQARIKVNAVARSSTGNTFITTSYRNQTLAQNNFSAYGTGQYAEYVTRRVKNATFFPAADNLTINLTYDNSANPSGVAWLDYIEVQVRRNLRYRSGALQFRDSRSVASGANAEFQITNAPSDLVVWDVTDPNSVVQMNLSFNNGTASFVNTADELREYVAFSGSDFSTPEYREALEPQNLRGMAVPEMLIVTHSDFTNQAERLAEFHEEDQGLKSAVVEVDKVFNEFSSGGQDIAAIRDLARMLYDQDNSGTFKYLLLFGDASYDYKNILTNNTNYVPVYQSNQSLSLGLSSITDDFYAYLDPNEGGGFNNSFLDLGVGRIPCETSNQASAYVDKVIHYSNNSASLGDWRNRILLLADDRDDSWEDTFVTSSEQLENRINNFSRAFNVEKIYTDAYTQESSTGTEKYPVASRDMFRKVQRGALITNYIGHGGEIGLASERLLDLSDVQNWSNFDALSMFLTITCEFTRFDDPKRVSAGEQLILKPDGGAIALLSTTRVVGVEIATRVNKAVFDTLLARPNGMPQTLGQMMKAAKNAPGVITNGTKKKFSLFGDPALRLAIPYFNVNTTQVNGNSVQAAPQDTIRALDKVSISGEVTDLNGQIISDYSGEINVSVFDKPQQKQTKVNDGVGRPLEFTLQNNLIHRGKARVVDGKFSTEFIVPKDIAFQFGTGKVSYYAENNQTDAAGAYEGITVGGLSENPPDDNRGPEINLFLNDESFVQGGITGPDPEIFAKLADSSGINIVGSSIGHDMVAILDGKNQESLILNDFYESDLNSFKTGSVRFPLFDLEEGSHTLTLRAFDVLNNFSETTTDFIVAQDEELTLRRVLNYPNPFTTYTDFQFEHNRAGQPLDVQVQIFTVSGKLVKTINTTINTTGNRVQGQVEWNGLDDYGDKIGKGVYVYRVKVRSQVDNSTADKYEKLVILR